MLEVSYPQRCKHSQCVLNFLASNKYILIYITYLSNSFKLVSLLEMPTNEEITNETALPSSIFPSDHIRIEAILCLDQIRIPNHH